MRTRCRNPNDASWPDYGARGVTVCERWDSFTNFLADMGERPEGHTLDRIDPAGDYEPSNCRWATHAQQRHNHRKTTKILLRLTPEELAAIDAARDCQGSRSGWIRMVLRERTEAA